MSYIAVPNQGAVTIAEILNINGNISFAIDGNSIKTCRLKMRIRKASGTMYAVLRFNNDATNVYDEHRIFSVVATPGTVAGGQNMATTSIGLTDVTFANGGFLVVTADLFLRAGTGFNRGCTFQSFSKELGSGNATSKNGGGDYLVSTGNITQVNVAFGAAPDDGEAILEYTT